LSGAGSALVQGKRFLLVQGKPRCGDLEKINAVIEAAKLRPEIEKRLSLDQIADALRLSEQGHVRGKLVVRVNRLPTPGS